MSEISPVYIIILAKMYFQIFLSLSLHLHLNGLNMETAMIKTGDNVLISPDLTGWPDWCEGVVIEVENNTFNGLVIAAKTKDLNVFFGRKELFKAIA